MGQPCIWYTTVAKRESNPESKLPYVVQKSPVPIGDSLCINSIFPIHHKRQHIARYGIPRPGGVLFCKTCCILLLYAVQ